MRIRTKTEYISGLDAFTRAYIECALWSTPDNSGDTLDRHYTVLDITMPTLRKMVKDCESFQWDNQDLLEQWYALDAAYRPSDAGYDFWLTRERHGCGFWSRYFEEPGRSLGEKLTEISHQYGEFPLVTRRGRIHHGG